MTFKLNFPKKTGAKNDTGGSYFKIIIVVLLCAGLLLITLGGDNEAADSENDDPSEEERLAKICSSLSGVGDCKVFIAYEDRTVSYSSRKERVIVGVAIICEGGSNDSVKARLSTLVDSLYGIGKNRITVDEMK